MRTPRTPSQGRYRGIEAAPGLLLIALLAGTAAAAAPPIGAAPAPPTISTKVTPAGSDQPRGKPRAYLTSPLGFSEAGRVF